MKRVIILLAVMAANLANGQMFAQRFAATSTARLPAEYQEVEYLQSTGTQYIDTGLTIIGRRWETKTAFISSASIAQGAIYNNAGTYYRCHNAGTSVFVTFNLAGGSLSVGGDVTATNVYSASTSLGISINGRAYTTVAGTLPDVSIYLFGRHGVGIASSCSAARVYYSKIWVETGNSLVQDFVPCYRKSDSVAGMYDSVNATFMVNSGTGSFIVGPNVN